MSESNRWLPGTNRSVLRPRASVVRAVSVLSLLICGVHAAAADEATRGFELYMSECSKCHGSMDVADATDGPRQSVHLAFAGQAVEHLCTGDRSSDSVQRDVCESAPLRLAFALPFGPNLAGILGRPAGTVAGYEYSKAFMAAFTGATWNEVMLDEYIADSQLQAPGIRMYYRQPDAEIRRLIIDFLKSRP